MKKRLLIIGLCILLMLSNALNIFLFMRSEASLYIQIAKPLDYDQNGYISASYIHLLDDHESAQIILLSMLNARSIPENAYPTGLPDGAVTVCYKGTGYPYEMWFYEDYIIFGNEYAAYKKIENDHNNPVPMLKELVASIKAGQ